MSRTDKDTPWWVLSEWYEPRHSRCQHSRFPRPGQQCDLPAAPRLEHPSKVRFTGRHCYWYPLWPVNFRSYFSWAPCPPPRWFRQHTWYDPDRTRTRDDCRKAIKEYRGSGGIDTIPRTDQHKHSAGAIWW